ncbi:sugar kinase, ribokinase [Owenweeksia hongkongensis DSM 17368]|uniref:Sugar kinase, ribokinase n=2 Tax=Owenweeksia TaxID=267986 RepID=G8R6Z9_OWEHD|nr:sugar kinase, ribokinase [Owenweeksia hongkongensis DSM 17368]
MSLLIVGTVAFDELITPFGESGKILGGSGTYAGLSASNFMDDINIVSVVGEDFPEEHLANFRKKGISTEGINVVKGGKTFFWKGKYHNDMNTRDTLDTQLNVLADFDPVIPESFRKSDFLMLGNLTPAVQMNVLDQMEERPKLVILDTMNFWMDIAMDELKAVLKKIDVLTINDEEARQLSGEYSLVRAAQKIFEMGPKYLIIKKGEHGALLFGEGEVFFAPALPLEEVFDPTGAGDTFAGGFIGHLAHTRDISFDNMKRAVIFGSALASFCVEKFGTERIAAITPEEMNERVSQFIELTQFEIEL